MSLRPASALRTAQALAMLPCDSCGLVCRDPHADRKMNHDPGTARASRCPRCGAALHRRKPDSLSRTLALTLAAAILYVPANLLPIMRTTTLFDTEDHTILGGVVLLWEQGSWDLAAIVFVASIMVPMIKLISLILLWHTARRGSIWHPAQRTRLYRLLELIGRWSMLDVLVVALLVALVRFGSLARVEAGPAAAAFGAVVVLTMLASRSFDPRLIWDAGRVR